jgi:hypothetical protein
MLRCRHRDRDWSVQLCSRSREALHAIHLSFAPVSLAGEGVYGVARVRRSPVTDQ